MFAGLSDVPTQAAVAAVPVGAESARDFICDPVFDRSGARELMVPAPLIADLNFDGRFGSEDMILMYQDRGLPDRLSGNDPHAIDEALDLIESMQLLGYETGQTINDAILCGEHSLSQQWSADEIFETETYHADGRTIRDAMTAFGSLDRPRYRAAQHFDQFGRLTAASFEIYREDSSALYSRSQMEYDDEGRVVYQSTMLFDAAGNLRRLTASVVFHDTAQIARSTDVRFFDVNGTTVSRNVHYFDDHSREIGTQNYTYERGRATSMTTLTYDTAGRLIRQSNSAPLPQADARFPAGFSPESYLIQVADAYQSVRQAQLDGYEQILRITALPAQYNLNTILQTLEVPTNEATRYRYLQYYFQLVKDLAKSVRTGDFSPIFSNYARALDPVTGDWSEWFRNLVSTHQLTLPLAPLRIADPRSLTDGAQALEFANVYWSLFGANPHRYFQGMAGDSTQHFADIMEGLRKVKSNIKMLEYRLQGGPPVFEWILTDDKSQFDELGIEKIVPLTYWHFFPYINGKYITDEVDEATVKDRVENDLTNEDVLYVIDIELWEVDGPGPISVEGLQKLRRSADLLHKYNPNLLVGYYRMLPKRNPSAAYQGEDSVAYQQWQQENDLIASVLASSVDVIFPSIYTVHLGEESQTTEQRWRVYAEESIRETRRIAEGKPVVPFVMAYYHRNGYDSVLQQPNNLKGWEWLEPELMLYQLLLLDQLGDGTVVYSDRRMGWQGLIDVRLASALTKFSELKAAGKTAEMLNVYETLMTTHHAQLMDKLTLEQALRQASFDSTKARTAGDVVREAALLAEIARLQVRLRSAIDLWGMLQRATV